jgi:Carbohydrate-binding family 9
MRHTSMLQLLTVAGTAFGTAVAVNPEMPALSVPGCPKTARIQYSKSVPDRTPFPLTQVNLCYSTSSIELTFTAYNETNFYYNASQGTNDAIYEYEVMEAFIYHGTNDPQTYYEFEVNPNNVTYQAVVYNPSKVRAAGAPFDHFYVTDPATDGFSAKTKLDRHAHLWTSEFTIPLGIFNVDNGTAKGTQWRMNFFRTITGPETYPNQTLGAWNPPNQANFHITPYFGRVNFV